MRIGLRCLLSAGDIVCLSGVMRELKKAHPALELVPIVPPAYEPIFAGNPYVSTGKVDRIIDLAGGLREHFLTSHLHGLHLTEAFGACVAKELGLAPFVNDVRGDLRATGARSIAEPYWIVSTAKRDITVKFWPHWQELVDSLRGRVQFVLVGQLGDFGGDIRGVIDLRGQTDLGGLLSLVKHCEGVVTPSSLPMHVAGAFGKPAVVLLGGFENPQWIRYTGHTILSTIGTLPCCVDRACYLKWADRTDTGRSAEQRCTALQSIGETIYARCMAQLSVEDVRQAILAYVS